MPLEPQPAESHGSAIAAADKRTGALRVFIPVLVFVLAGLGVVAWFLMRPDYTLEGDDINRGNWPVILKHSQLWQCYFEHRHAGAGRRPYLSFELELSKHRDGREVATEFFLRALEVSTRDRLHETKKIVKGGAIDKFMAAVVVDDLASKTLLAASKEDPGVIDRLAEWLQEESMMQPVPFIDLLGSIGPPAKSAVPALGTRQQLKQPVEVRRAAIQAVSRILDPGEDAEQLIETLKPVTGDTDDVILDQVFRLLVRAGPAAANMLAEVGESGTAQSRIRALDALIELGPRNAGAVETLKRLTSAEDREVQRLAIVALGANASKDQAVLDLLGRFASRDEDREDIRVAARRAYIVQSLVGSSWQMTMKRHLEYTDYLAPDRDGQEDGGDSKVDMNPKSYFLLFDTGGTLRWMNVDTRYEGTGTWWFDGINVNLRLTDEEIYTAAITNTSLQRLNGKGLDVKAYGGFVRTTFRATCRK